MLISDYLSSNIIICILFLICTYFREVGQKYKNIFVRFLVQMKTLKFASEIYWPLKRVSALEWVAEKERDLYIKAKNEVTKLKSF